MSSTPELLRESRLLIAAVQRDQQVLRASAAQEINLLQEEIEKERHHPSNKAEILNTERGDVDPVELQRQIEENAQPERKVILTPAEIELKETLDQNNKLFKIIEELQQELLESNKIGEEMQSRVTKVRAEMEKWRMDQRQAQEQFSHAKPSASIPEEEILEVKQKFVHSKSQKEHLESQISQIKLQKRELLSRLRKAMEIVNKSPEHEGKTLEQQAIEKEQKNTQAAIKDPVKNEVIYKLEEHIDILEDELKITQRENSILMEDNRRWTEDLLMANQMLLKAKKRLEMEDLDSTLASRSLRVTNDNRRVEEQMAREESEARWDVAHQENPGQELLEKSKQLDRLIEEYETRIVPAMQKQIVLKEEIIQKLSEDCRHEAEEEDMFESELRKRQLENAELKEDIEKTVRVDIKKAQLEDK